jgi:hypothetical protein
VKPRQAGSPAEQEEQAEAAVSEYLPAAQLVQSVELEPTTKEAVPKAHCAHAVAPE